MASEVFRSYTGRDPEELRRAMQSEDLARWQEHETGVSRTDRIAALVALCEEVIDDLNQTEDAEWRQEMILQIADYRERLAELKGK